ncbi:MAG: Dna2/Cas4 domain-containing protein [archaeon]|nr:Dna2/Cas4 domain-containing protein [archaeon]
MKLVPVSAISAHDYCECQIVLRYVRKIRVWTPKIEKGISVHKTLETEFLKKADISDTIENIVTRAEKENTAFSARELFVRSKEEKMIGKIDEVEIHPDKIMIIDDKPNAKAYDSSKLQVTGYCIVFEAVHNLGKDIFGAIRDRDTGTIIWEEKFKQDSDLSAKVKDNVSRILDLASGKAIPKPTENKSRCDACSYLESCTYRI